MNIEDLDIRELFLEGVLTANAVRILLMGEFEKNYGPQSTATSSGRSKQLSSRNGKRA